MTKTSLTCYCDKIKEKEVGLSYSKNGRQKFRPVLVKEAAGSIWSQGVHV
jgi:hypothetical protein